MGVGGRGRGVFLGDLISLFVLKGGKVGGRGKRKGKEKEGKLVDEIAYTLISHI